MMLLLSVWILKGVKPNGWMMDKAKSGFSYENLEILWLNILKHKICMIKGRNYFSILIESFRFPFLLIPEAKRVEQS